MILEEVEEVSAELVAVVKVEEEEVVEDEEEEGDPKAKQLLGYL
jgi:hypothetical protein